MKDNVQNYVDRYSMEDRLQWREIAAKMPFFEVPAGYQISVIPPFGGAEVRFLVKRPDGKKISVYADFYTSLGYMPEPYWEVYPYLDDVGRCGIDEVDKLWEMIMSTEVLE